MKQAVYALLNRLMILRQKEEPVEGGRPLINAHEGAVAALVAPQQMHMYEAPQPQQTAIAFEAAAARKSLVERLDEFLGRRTGGDNLGLGLRGE